MMRRFAGRPNVALGLFRLVANVNEVDLESTQSFHQLGKMDMRLRSALAPDAFLSMSTYASG